MFLKIFLLAYCVYYTKSASVEYSEAQEAIQWNIYLNEIYEKAKLPTTHSGITPFSLENQHLTRLQLRELEAVNETVNEPPQFVCSENKLVISGTVIKISSLTNFTCNDKTTLIEIFASDTIVFDKNVNLEGFYGILSIIAPTWTVQGQIEVNLNGKPAETMSESKAPDGSTNGAAGSNGIPGYPGNTAGSFMGLVQTVVNVENLKILASGSDGSKGQDGGDGADGRKGRVADVENHLYDCYKNVARWHCKGEPGQPGGNGGDGGVGGNGGYAGIIKMMNLEDNSTIPSYVAKAGSKGPSGVGGKGGEGGIEGDAWYGDYVLVGWGLIEKEYSGTVRNVSGTTGKTGSVTSGIKSPEPQINIDSEVENVINDYKYFLQKSLQDDFTREQGYSFLVKLMQNEEFQPYYTPKGIIQEFIHLEEYFYSLSDKIDYLPLYNALLEHITARAYENEEKKVLAQLYTTTLSKICALQEQTNKNFITDLKTFLDICIDNIKELHQLQEVVTINEYTTIYEDQIDEEVEEAKGLIDQHITQQIDDSLSKIDKSINGLWNDIFELEREAETRAQELEEAKREMKNNMIGKIIGKAIKGVGNVLSFLVPLGGVAKGIISGTSTVIEYFSSGNNSKVLQDVNTFDDLRERYPALENANKPATQEAIENFVSNLEDMEALITPEMTELESIKENLQQIVEKLNSWNGTSEEELQKMYISELDNLEAKLNEGQEIKRRGIVDDVREKLKSQTNSEKKAAKVPTEFQDIFKIFKNDTEKMDTFTEMIEENKQTIEDIKKYKQRIQDTLKPMLEQLTVTFHDFENSLENKTSVELQFAQWQIQDTLNNVKEILEEYTEGFNAQSEITSSIGIISDSMNKMIAVYEKIQNFENQKKLYDYVALVNSATYQTIKVDDPELNSAFDKLVLYLKSNIILQKYRQSITQIKQFAFPLVETYFKQMNLPQALNMTDDNGNIEVYTNQAITQIEKFQTNLADSTMYILKYDDIKHRSKFYDSYPAGPFYVWKNNTDYESISKLLSGEEVVFYADPNSNTKNGVKFSLIDVNFKVSDDTKQQNLNKILENFEISLTHLGSNYYNCDNKTYLVNTMSQKFQFGFKKYNDLNGDFDMVFDKTHKGNYLLSPYTSWKIQLLGSAEDIALLKTYGDGADLQLAGDGEYFDNDPHLCAQNLDFYYELQSVIQKKEAKCLRALTNGVIDKNNACFVDYVANSSRQ